MDLEALKREVCAGVDALARELVATSRAIHAAPELCFEEHKAAARLTADIERNGLTVDRGAYGLATAFRCDIGKGKGPTVALLAEYDALPGIGHACGHNLIATAALGATLALERLGDRLPGRVRLLGTPAEEGGGGKEIMARRGAFEGVDAALMIHPAGFNLATTPCLAISRVAVAFHGKAAHASAQPWDGINALDALVTAYQAVAQLRQHIKPTERLHGIITEGGEAANIVPVRAAGTFYVRAADAPALVKLKPRVEACFQGAATTSGAKVTIEWGDVDYLDLITNWPLAGAFQANAEALGRTFLNLDDLPRGWAGSTDMGNVSQIVPAIHPLLEAAPRDVVIHNPEFARWAGSEKGDKAALDGAKALAMTALDFLGRADLRAEVARTFAAAKAEQAAA
ncbi:MAG: M20 family peptidase [Alphaproteobacteria bacterium]|nr:M20 family peptidase [Alphaproteobacteria bacterium]